MKRIGFVLVFAFIVMISVVVGVKLGKNADSINNENIDVVTEEQTIVGKYTVLRKYKRPTDKLYYTQGFLFKDSNTIIESSGLYGESNIQLVEFPSFKVLKQVPLRSDIFAEGCDLITDKNHNHLIYQLTWQNRKVFVYNADTLEKNSTLDLPREIQEGWGLTHSEITDEQGVSKTVLLVSDGSSNIYTVDPETWKVIKTTGVTDENGNSQGMLNELEMYKGKLFANIYLSQYIVAIDPKSGKILKRYDFGSIKDEVFSSAEFVSRNFNDGHCLNGMAYDEATDRFLITGKKWAYVYEIKIDDKL